MGTVSKEFRNYEVNAKNAYDDAQLQFIRNTLVPVVVTRNEETMILEFEVGDAVSVSTMRDLDLDKRYLMLLNTFDVVETKKNLKFKLHPDNLVVDVNLVPRVLMRDVYSDQESYDEAEAVDEMKALIGYLLNKSYTFEDFNNGGLSLLQKKANTSVYYDIHDLKSLRTALKDAYVKYETRKHDHYELTKIKKNQRQRWLLRVIVVLLIAAIGLSSYWGLFVFPRMASITASQERFIENNYLATVESAEKVPMNKLDINNKYMLAYSYIKIEALSDEQKKNILSSISINSNELILEYWIYLGRNALAKSEDIAKQLGNNEYLMYAYLKEKEKTLTDTSLSGNDKETKINELEGKIKTLQEQIEGSGKQGG